MSRERQYAEARIDHMNSRKDQTSTQVKKKKSSAVLRPKSIDAEEGKLKMGCNTTNTNASS